MHVTELRPPVAASFLWCEWAFFCQLVLKLGIDEETFNEFLYFLEPFTSLLCIQLFLLCRQLQKTHKICVNFHNGCTDAGY